MPRIRLLQTFAATTEAAHVRPRQLVKDSPVGHARLDQDFDGAATLLQPRLQLDDGAGGTLTGVDVRTPAVSPYWRVDGVDPGVILVGDLEISAKLDGGEREWKRSLLASTGYRFAGDFAFSPLGVEVDRGGPPPGETTPVDFGLDLYDLVTGATASIPLLTSGYGIGSDRDYDASGHVLSLQGRGPEVRYQEIEIDMDLAPEHGSTNGELAVLAMQAAGVPAALIGIDPTIGSARSIGVEYSCAPLWAVLRDILRPIGYQVLAGADDGVFRAVELQPEDTPALIEVIAGPGGDLEEAKLFSIAAKGAQPVCAEVVGVRIDDTSPTSPTSGLVTESIVIETYDDNFVLPTAVASQASGSSTISPTGVVPGPAQRTLVHRTTIEVTTLDGCEILTYTKEEGFYNPRAARYLAAADPNGGSPGVWTYPSRNVYFYDSTPVADDSQEGFLWATDRFTTLSEQWSRPQWRADGRRTGTITSTAGWRNPAASIKARATAATTWEATNYTTGRPLLASGAGVLFEFERYFAGPVGASSETLAIPGDTYESAQSVYPISAAVFGEVILRYLTYEVETRTIDDDDYETAVETVRTAWGIRNGVLYLYASGEGGSVNEIGLSATTSEARAQIGGKPTTIQSGTDEQGVTTPTVVTRGGGRGLPAAEICNDELVNEARKTDFTVTVCAARDDGAGGETALTGKPLRLKSDFVETPEEAERWGLRELQILRGFPCKLYLASPCPVLDVGDVVTVNVPEIKTAAFDAVVWEREAKIPGEPQGRIEDVVTILIPPWS